MLCDPVGNFFLKCRSKLLVKINKTAVRYTEKVVSSMNRQKTGYCEIILVRGGQFWLIVKILLVHEHVILWVTALLHYNASQFITLLNVPGDVNSLVRVTHKIHEHCSPTNNVDSTVHLHKYTYRI